jgi:hypothetical protein
MILLQEVDLFVQRVDLGLKGALFGSVRGSEVITVLQVTGELGISGRQGIDLCLCSFEFF